MPNVKSDMRTPPIEITLSRKPEDEFNHLSAPDDCLCLVAAVHEGEPLLGLVLVRPRVRGDHPLELLPGPGRLLFPLGRPQRHRRRRRPHHLPGRLRGRPGAGLALLLLLLLFDEPLQVVGVPDEVVAPEGPGRVATHLLAHAQFVPLQALRGKSEGRGA